MTELGPILERLGLDQYLDALLGEGFDTWETVLDIQERDLDALNVKLGHRRKLQREIANYRGIPYERVVGSPAQEHLVEAGKSGEAARARSQYGDKVMSPAGEAKRKYRRHPKPDENAPERPPSAYVIFSNKVREEIKGENLSFTDIAKLVGERWQTLDPSEKETYDNRAAAAKERYNIQLSAYKKTDTYKEYARYLADFKTRHGGAVEGKRPKLDKDESSTTSLSARSGDFTDTNHIHQRVGSVGSMSSTSIQIPSSGSLPLSFSPVGSQVPGMRQSAGPSPRLDSPTAPAPGVHKLKSAFSAQSSTSEESWTSRSDQADAVQRTAQLSLMPASPLHPSLASLSSGEMATFDPNGRWPLRNSYVPGQRESLPPINSDMASFQQSNMHTVGGLPLASSEERWRTMLSDLAARPTGDPSRSSLSSHNLAQAGSVVATQLPRLINSDRGSDLPYDHHQRTLPPPRGHGRTLPGLSRELVTAGYSGAASAAGDASGGGRGDATHLDRSESEAVDALAGLAATGAKREGSEEQGGAHGAMRH